MENEQMITFEQDVEFNTGRHYAPGGQVIRATLLDIQPCPIFPDFCRVAVVEFDDTARRIRGIVRVDATECGAAAPADVLKAYDAGNYDLA